MISRLTKFFLFFIAPVLLAITIFITYISFSRLVFPYDLTLKNGKKVSVVAAKIRNKLLKQKDIKFVNFKSKDGIKLAGYLVKRGKATANFLVCHGYQSRKEFVSAAINAFPNFNILIFDFRAHGQSEGKYRTLGCNEYKDVIAAAQFLQANTKVQKNLPNQLPLIIWGFSMGGAAALKATEYEQSIADAFIIDSAFCDMRSVIYNSFSLKSKLPTIPFLPILEKTTNFVAGCDISKMRPIQNVQKITQPIFFVHSCTDKIVPPSHSLEMYAKAKENNDQTKLWITPKIQHAKTIDENLEIYVKKINKFLKNTLKI